MGGYKYEIEFQEEDINGYDHWITIEFNDVDDWNIVNKEEIEMNIDVDSEDFIYWVEHDIREYMADLQNAKACQWYDNNFN